MGARLPLLVWLYWPWYGKGNTLVEVEGDEILEFMYKALIFLCSIANLADKLEVRLFPARPPSDDHIDN